MDLALALEQELLRRGQSGPVGAGSITLTDPVGNQLDVLYASLDSMSCAVDELQLILPGAAGLPFAELRKWAEALSKRITYLLEQIGPLEFDSQANEALIRSTSPSQLPHGAVYYEFLLKTRGTRTITLNRFRANAGQPGRQPVPMQLTHEVLVRLVKDLLETFPNP
jgi:hypothetical protein